MKRKDYSEDSQKTYTYNSREGFGAPTLKEKIELKEDGFKIIYNPNLQDPDKARIEHSFGE